MEDKFHPRGLKRKLVLDDEDDDSNKVYRFKVLLPNGTSVGLTLKDKEPEISFQGFIGLIRDEYDVVRRQSESVKRKRMINWKSESLYIEGAHDGKPKSRLNLRHYHPHKCHILRLHVSLFNRKDVVYSLFGLP